MKNKIINFLKNSLVYKKLLLNIDILKTYYFKLSKREQSFLFAALVFIIFILFIIIILSMIKIKNNFDNDIVNNKKLLLEVNNLASSYKQITLLMPNTYTEPTNEKISADINDVLHIKNADIRVDNQVVTINIDNVEFNLLIIFLDEMRKSYGLFPSKLKIAKQSKSGFVACNIILKR